MDRRNMLLSLFAAPLAPFVAPKRESGTVVETLKLEVDTSQVQRIIAQLEADMPNRIRAALADARMRGRLG
jgi:hypothetical protein